MDRQRKEFVASGSKFLPNTSRSYLHKAYKKETDKRKRDRLLAYMQRKDDLGVEQIAKNLDRAHSTISKWLIRAQDEGIRARHERPGRGRKHKLSESQLKQLAADLKSGSEECGFESSLWDSGLMRRHIKKKFGIEYSKSGTRLLARELGFSWRKPRPKNPKAVSKQKQNEFKEASQELIREKEAQGYTVLAEDESSIQKTSNSPKHGWLRRGMSVTAPVSLSRQRRYMFGVLAVNIFYYMFYDKTNTDSFCDFLEKVHEKYGKVLIFLDNASYHKSVGVREMLEKYKGEIILEYLPPYAPELNPVEIQWREIKRRLSAKMFDTLDEMEQSVRKMFASGEILPVKMFRYLMG